MSAFIDQDDPSTRSLRTILLGFKREVLWIVIFGFFSNLLMLVPTLYMMQVFDRVMVSNSEYTLAALRLATSWM